MGCGSSTNTQVQPLAPPGATGDEDETGSKLSSRGDSAVSKGTTDSGVVMESKEMPALPGAVPGKLPPLTSERVEGSEADGFTEDADTSGLLQQDSAVQERQKSSEILEELLSQGIIPVGQSEERSSGAGQAYSIMLDDRDVVKRKPPARLESLKARKMQNLPSREEIEEKIRLAEERRKSREDRLKARLRTKSARVRAPVPTTEEDADTFLTPVEPLQLPLPADPTPAPFDSQVTRGAAEGAESAREAAGDDGEREEETGGEGRVSGHNRGEGARWGSKDGEGEELNQVEELQAGGLLGASGELESDSSFQRAGDKEEAF